MLSLRHGAVARRLKVLTECVRDKVRNREYVRDKAQALAAIRAAVEAAGLDPKGNEGLHYYRYSDRELERLGDTPELQAADAAFTAADPKLSRYVSGAAEIAPYALRWAGRPPPRNGAAPFDWYGWALAFLSAAAPPRKKAAGSRRRQPDAPQGVRRP